MTRIQQEKIYKFRVRFTGGVHRHFYAIATNLWEAWKIAEIRIHDLVPELKILELVGYEEIPVGLFGPEEA